MGDKPTNGWEVWGRHVLEELKRLNKCYETLQHDVGKIKGEVEGLKVKAGVWGVIGGGIPILITIAIWFFIKGI